MLLPVIDSDAEGLKYVPLAKARLKLLEEQRKRDGLPFIHRRVFAADGVTVDVTASAFAPKIRIRRSGLQAVAQYRGVGVDGLFYETIAAFNLGGALIWRHDLPASDKYRAWILGMSDDGARVAYLYAGETSLEVRFIVGGKAEPSIGTYPSSFVSVDGARLKFKLSRNAKRVVLGWLRTVGLSIEPTILLCGADLEPSYVELDTIPPFGNTSDDFMFGADEHLGTVYTGRSRFDYVFSADLTVKKAVVVGDNAPFSVLKSDYTVEPYDGSFQFEYGGLSVSASGVLVVGYGRIAPWPGVSAYETTFSSAAVTFAGGTTLRATPSRRGEVFDTDPPSFAVARPLATSRDASAVLLWELIDGGTVFQSTGFFKNNTSFSSGFEPGAISADGRLVVGAVSGVPTVVRAEGTYATPELGVISARPPFGPTVFSSGTILSQIAVAVSSSRVALRAFPESYLEGGVFLGYGPAVVAGPTLPLQLPRTVPSLSAPVTQNLLRRGDGLGDPDFLATRGVV